MSGALTGPGVVGGLLLLGLGTLAMKSVGPVVVGGGRRVPGWLTAAGGVLPTALLSALVATEVLGGDGPDPARLAGVGVAAAAVALRAPFVVVVLAATATTAVLRLLT